MKKIFLFSALLFLSKFVDGKIEVILSLLSN